MNDATTTLTRADGHAPVTTKVESASNIFWQQSNSEWRFLSNVGTLQFIGSNYVPTVRMHLTSR